MNAATSVHVHVKHPNVNAAAEQMPAAAVRTVYAVTAAVDAAATN